MCNIYDSIRLIIVLGLLFFVSCKKDTDIAGPAVEINTPYENQSYNVLDIISVSGSASDDTKITSISIALLDAQQQIVHVSVSVPVTSANMTFNTQYVLDNIHLESGVYYLMVTASDGKNDTRKYRKLYLVAVPKVLQRIYVVSNVSSSQTNWGYVDSTFSGITPFTNFSGDYLSSSVSSYYQQLHNCGNYTGSYTVYDLTNNLIKFNIPGSVSSTPYFTGYTTASNNTYVARYDEFIKGYNYKGEPVFNATTISGYYSKQIIFNGGVMVSEQKNILSGNKILVTYYATGVPDIQTNLLQDVVTMIEKDNTNVFLFGNISGQGVIQLYDRVNNNLWNPYPFSLATGSILSAVKINSDAYLIGHSNGTIYKYQYQTSGVTSYLTGYVAKQLKYDEAANKLYVVENNKVTCLDYSTAGYLNSVTSAENVLDVHLLFNR